MGREMAVELDKLKSRKLSTRSDSVLMVEGRKLEAFYMLGSTLDTESVWPQLLSQKVIEMTSEELLNVIYDRKRAADGLAALEKRVQQAIDDEFAAKK
ncbi:hypothetical protein [Paenibacillus ginsengarvi]|uniref:Uncharacterized protein n=1 Tax=Paenibacillus ginsengarvi TaxID=400777 RepID=A0A3B0CF00_9BACL|nr:hypothetical protein [Paenibacillus ginsengarvi]RKN84575.1 hypothetical protein D7M11_11280 [Paenibacillus ginsengarvi]